MFHKINWINNIEKTEKSLSQGLEWEEKQRHHIPKRIFLFYVTANSGMVSEVVHSKLKNSECWRAWYLYDCNNCATMFSGDFCCVWSFKEILWGII